MEPTLEKRNNGDLYKNLMQMLRHKKGIGGRGGGTRPLRQGKKRGKMVSAFIDKTRYHPRDESRHFDSSVTT